MKLLTSIPPRRDGTVVACHGEKKFEFKADENGDMVGEVDDPEALGLLLATGNFIPFDENDMAAAVALVQNDGEPDDEDPDDEGDEGDDDEVPAGSLPIEAGTPPATRPGKGRKAR